MSRSRPASNPISFHKHTKQYYVTRGGKRIYFIGYSLILNGTVFGGQASLLEWLKKLFDTLHRRDKFTAKGYLRSIAKIRDGFLIKMRRPPDHKLAKKLARRFKGKAAEDYFRFLTEPDVEPTNNGTERQIRPVVIDRRITQGTRGDAGMR